METKDKVKALEGLRDKLKKDCERRKLLCHGSCKEYQDSDGCWKWRVYRWTYS